MKPILLLGATFIGTLVLFLGFKYSILQVSSASMEPTLCTGDLILVKRMIASSNDSDLHGQVVVAHHGNGQPIVKRVIGLPGDVVQITDRALYLNNQTLREPYSCVSGISRSDQQLYAKMVKMSSGQLFVVGDNRNVSQDSRSYGAISVSDITGLVIGSVHLPFFETCRCGR